MTTSGLRRAEESPTPFRPLPARATLIRALEVRQELAALTRWCEDKPLWIDLYVEANLKSFCKGYTAPVFHDCSAQDCSMLSIELELVDEASFKASLARDGGCEDDFSPEANTAAIRRKP